MDSHKSMENLVSRVDISWTTPLNMNELPIYVVSKNDHDISLVIQSFHLCWGRLFLSL